MLSSKYITGLTEIDERHAGFVKMLDEVGDEYSASFKKALETVHNCSAASPAHFQCAPARGAIYEEAR